MRFCFFILLACACISAHAQTPVHRPVQAAAADSIESFQTEEGLAFYTWDITPAVFSFTLYDRWGNALATTTNPAFIIDDLLQGPTHLQFGDVYFAMVAYAGADGTKKSFTAAYRYTGYYRCG